MQHPRLGQVATSRKIEFLGFQIEFLDFQIEFLGLETNFGGILMNSGLFLSFRWFDFGLKIEFLNIFNRVSWQKSSFINFGIIEFLPKRTKKSL